MTKNGFIETYYRENYDNLVKYARKRVGNYDLYLAEEALQEAFYKALKYYRAYNKNDDFSKWFGRILLNCINDLKRAERDRGVNSSNQPHHDYIVSVSFSKQVLDQLQRETPRNIEILNMYFFYGYKSREVAEFMHISHDVVRDVIRTFRRRARND